MKTKRRTVALLPGSGLKWLVYGLLTLCVMLMQMAPRFFPVVAGARPVPLVLLVVCVALFEGARMGAGIGLLAGLLWDVYVFRPFGFDALILMVVGLMVGLLVQWLLRANFLAAMLLSIGSVLAQSLLEWICCYLLFRKEQMWQILVKVYLPNALYTVLLAPLMFWLILWIARLLRRRTNG